MADDAAEDPGRMALKGGRVVPTGPAIGGASGGGPSGGPAPVAPVAPPAPARATFSPSAAFGRPEALGETSLIKAVRQGDVRTATYLLEQRANPNEKDHFGETALMEAAAQGQPALVKMLLEQGATLEYQSPSGLTARKLAEEHEVLKPLGRSVRKHVKTKETR